MFDSKHAQYLITEVSLLETLLIIVLDFLWKFYCMAGLKLTTILEYYDLLWSQYSNFILFLGFLLGNRHKSKGGHTAHTTQEEATVWRAGEWKFVHVFSACVFVFMCVLQDPLVVVFQAYRLSQAKLSSLLWVWEWSKSRKQWVSHSPCSSSVSLIWTITSLDSVAA